MEQYQHQKPVQNSPKGPSSVMFSVRTTCNRSAIDTTKENSMGMRIMKAGTPVARVRINPNSHRRAAEPTSVVNLVQPVFCATEKEGQCDYQLRRWHVYKPLVCVTYFVLPARFRKRRNTHNNKTDKDYCTSHIFRLSTVLAELAGHKLLVECGWARPVVVCVRATVLWARRSVLQEVRQPSRPERTVEFARCAPPLWQRTDRSSLWYLVHKRPIKQ